MKVTLILGCTISFCVLGLVSGVLATKVMLTSSHVQGEELLAVVLAPPAVGAIFGLLVGLIATAFVRWPDRKQVPPPVNPTAGQSG